MAKQQQVATTDANMAFIFASEAPSHLRLPVEGDAGPTGNENIGADDIALPRIDLLQALSPAVSGDEDRTIEGATPGLFLNTVTKELSREVYLMNLAYRRQFVVYRTRKAGGGFLGVGSTQQEADEIVEAHMDSEDACPTEVVETAEHYCMVVDPKTGAGAPCLLSWTSSKLSISRMWNSQIMERCRASDGASLPRFAGVWKLSSARKTNTKGTYFVPKVEFAGWAQPAQADQARAMASTVVV